MLAGVSWVVYKRFHCQEVAELGYKPLPLCLQRLEAHTILVGGIWRLCLDYRLTVRWLKMQQILRVHSALLILWCLTNLSSLKWKPSLYSWRTLILTPPWTTVTLALAPPGKINKPLGWFAPRGPCSDPTHSRRHPMGPVPPSVHRNKGTRKSTAISQTGRLPQEQWCLMMPLSFFFPFKSNL